MVLGNFFGVQIANTSLNFVIGNTVTRNVSVGIAIVGPAAERNKIQKNTVSTNGGYATGKVDGPFTLGVNDPGSYIFGTGIYVEAAQKNIIGSEPVKVGRKTTEDISNRNTLDDNTLVGIYLFGGALYNKVRSNIIYGSQHPNTKLSYEKSPRTVWNGDYGILLYNSAGNLFDIQLNGQYQNKISKARIAQFREFTGAVASGPAKVPPLPPTSTRGGSGGRSR